MVQSEIRLIYSMNERLHNYEMSAIGMKKRRRKKNEREKREKFSFLLLCVLLSKERIRERAKI